MSLRQQALLVILLSPAIALLLMFIVGHNGITVAGLSIAAICIGVAFAVQWLAFVPSYLKQTEKYFDLTGSLTYISVAVVAILLGTEGNLRGLAVGLMVIIWAARLGSFLFLRIRKSGSDGRFDTIIPDFRVFLMTWTLQAMWVSITVSCALAVMTSADKLPLDLWFAIGLSAWVAGLVIEVIADRQKTRFRANPDNANRYITTGLWAWSRHPNYFGEILLWVGIAIIALPVLQGWQYITLASPIFVYFLLTRVSGARMLERRNDKIWGGEPAYQEYKNNTPMIFLLPPSRSSATRRIHSGPV
jgi:steroid 5-alpha reductase family enzyme